MWTANGDRRLLLDVLQESTDFGELPVEQADLSDLRSGVGFTLAWPDDPRKHRKLPSLIVATREEQLRLFAWSWTYVQHLRPLTASVRVTDLPDALRRLRPGAEVSLREIRVPAVGLMIGETMAHLGSRFSPSNLSPVAFENTLSFAIFRAISLGMGGGLPRALATAWLDARRITGQPQLPIRAEDVEAAWNILIACSYGETESMTVATKPSPKILRACKELQGSGDITAETWDALTEGTPSLHAVRPAMSGPVEERVSAVERVFASVLPDDVITPFVCGYLVSQIAPGSLDHLVLATSYGSRDPRCYLWYALCAGLRPKSQVLRFGSGIGMRLARDSGRPEDILAPPTCDIGLAELEVASRTDTGRPVFMTSAQGLVNVEIFPCVSTLLKWSDKRSDQVGLFDAGIADLSAVRTCAENLEQTIHALSDISRTLKKSIGNEESVAEPPGRKPRRR